MGRGWQRRQANDGRRQKPPVIAPSNPPDPVVLELYRISVEMADRVSARRSTANSFFLALQTGLAAVLAVFVATLGNEDTASADPIIVTIAASGGVILAVAWWLLLRSYRDLNRAKFSVISAIETQYLPAQPFNDEWRSLEKDRVSGWRGRYAELSTIERVIPVLFAGLYIALAVRVISL